MKTSIDDLKTNLLKTALFYPLMFCPYVQQSCKYFNPQFFYPVYKEEKHGCLIFPECFWIEKRKAMKGDDESSC